MSKNSQTDLDLISEASFLSVEVDCDRGVKSKQVRFDMCSSSVEPKAANVFLHADAPSQENLTECDDMYTVDDAQLHSSLFPSVTPSESLDLSVFDEPQLQQTLEALSLDEPKMNSVRMLQEEVIQIANRIHKASQSVASNAEKLEVVQRQGVRGKCSRGSGSIGMNYTRKEQLYKDLLAVSVDDDEVVQAERDKMARRRRLLLAEAARLHPPKAEVLPEPSPLKFFDPERDVFQSVRLGITGLINQQLLPENLTTAEQLDFVRLDYRLCTEPSYFI
ncbi:unnamed protein product [Hydatigera taeniaeformis]|uniref:PPP1R35_C domain-containing protein n=1 Tax=Hydatigena taeniaeformis TaxID=6205 RepID=A0A0R3X4U4_HYDTA|nr:unnamed protein product [Hydatigera taeniaeformis]